MGNLADSASSTSLNYQEIMRIYPKRIVAENKKKRSDHQGLKQSRIDSGLHLHMVILA